MVVLHSQKRETDPQGDRSTVTSKRLVLGAGEARGPRNTLPAGSARSRANPYPVS